MKTLILTLFFIIGMISVASADCTYDGKTYKTGTQIGGLVCQPDGTWKPKN